MVQVGSHQRFHVQGVWQVQDILDACRTCSVVLCIAFLFFQGRRKETKKVERKTHVGRPQLVCSIWALVVIMYYKMLIKVSVCEQYVHPMDCQYHRWQGSHASGMVRAQGSRVSRYSSSWFPDIITLKSNQVTEVS
jgi:hypothetical protein